MKQKDIVKFCGNFHRDSEYNDYLAELNIFFEYQTTKQLKEFLEKHQKQRVNIVFKDAELLNEEFVKDLKDITKDYNVAFKLDWSIKEELDGSIRYLFEREGLKYYYNDVIDNWDNLNEIAAAGVCDVYVGNSMGFEIIDVGASLWAKHIHTRVYPNVAQSAASGAAAITKFFIRPEDCLAYAKYVDVFEFFEPLGVYKNIDELFNIYKYEKRWYGDLKHIIFGLDESIDNRLLDEHWCISRMNCGKRCAKNQSCKICDRFVEMSRLMSEKEKELHYFLKK